jgi:hypothetical protein
MVAVEIAVKKNYLTLRQRQRWQLFLLRVVVLVVALLPLPLPLLLALVMIRRARIFHCLRDGGSNVVARTGTTTISTPTLA